MEVLLISAKSACDVSPHGRLVARAVAFRLSSWGAGLNARPFSWAPFMVLFLVTLAPRLLCPSQPLVENFIDRQVHTAMIARNLARGGSLLYPEIDIGPFPAYYMLEFPAYPWLAETLAAFFSVPLDAM